MATEGLLPSTRSSNDFVTAIKEQLEQQYRNDVLRFESVFADYSALLRKAHELEVWIW